MQVMGTNTMDIQVKRLYKLENNQGLKAFADIAVNDSILIKGVRVMDGKNGLFVSMPREQGKDKKWYDSVRCLNKDVQQQLAEAVLDAYQTDRA